MIYLRQGAGVHQKNANGKLRRGQAGNVRAREAIQSDYERTLPPLRLLISFEEPISEFL